VLVSEVFIISVVGTFVLVPGFFLALQSEPECKSIKVVPAMY
jgi:hypothetical protein